MAELVAAASAAEHGAGAPPAGRASPGLHKASVGLIAGGLALSGLALASRAGLVTLGYGYVWGFVFVWGIVLGSLFFVGLQHLVHARWSIVVRRAAEMLASAMPWVALLFLPVVAVLLAHPTFQVFPWADPARMHADHLLAGKAPYLNKTFFLVRAGVFFAGWVWLARRFVATSLAQDRGQGGAAASVGLRKLGAFLVAFFGASATFAGLDWLMSLEPRWFSTMFGVYVIAGVIVSSLAAITLAVVRLRRSGRLGDGWVGADHLYNLGALMFGFTCFWAYIAFSQFMLIWYAHMPEETFYFVARLEGGWLWLTLLLPILRFVVPFAMLLARPSKSDSRTLERVSVVILVGQAADLFWVIAPQMERNASAAVAAVLAEGGWVRVAMLGPVLLLSGILLRAVGAFLAKHPAVAIGDPLLGESRRFHL